MRIVRRHLPLACLGVFLVMGAGVVLPAGAQTTAPNEWTWMGGSNTVGNNWYQTGVYGTLGTPSAQNIPASRSYAARWTDASGHFWLFGGTVSYPTVNSPNIYYLNDLWEFNPSTNEWTWMGGSSAFSNTCAQYSSSNADCGQPGIYGTLGTPASANLPGARDDAASWTDGKGNLWLFGGFGVDSAGNYGSLNDLWEFSPVTNQWTWMGGGSTVPKSNNAVAGQPGIYGSMGAAAAGNIPGGRSGALSWVDSGGNLWLFGGTGFDADDLPALLNDAWEFNPSNNEWAWMGGNSTFSGEFSGVPVYGTLGTFATGNDPGGRQDATGWVDTSGHVWLFGGIGPPGEPGEVALNDLWEFNPANGQWAWMGGSNTLPNGLFDWPGVYGTLGTPAAGNIPGSRSGAVGWIDKSGDPWLFGGVGANVVASVGDLGDLWEFSSASSQWSWMGGSNIWPDGYVDWPGVYGTLGIPASGNVAGSRDGAASWTDARGNFWLFGGNGNDAIGALGVLNDLWEYEPSSTPSFTAVAPPVFSPPAGDYATAPSVSITVTTPGTVIFYTTDGSKPTISSTTFAGNPIAVSSNETIQAIAVAPNYFNSAVASATYTIAPAAATPTFGVAAGTYATNQSVAIADATAGATIYYTTNGTTPTTGSTVYSGPIPVMASETIEAVAVANGYSTSAVATATYTIPQSFGLALNPTSMTVKAGASGTSTVTVQDEGGFNGNVSFACSGLPAGAGCSFSTLTAPTPAGVSYTTLTVTTSSNTAEVRRTSGALLPGAAMAVVVCCFGLRKRRRLLMLVVLAVGLGGLGLMDGCGGGGSGGGGGGGGTQPVTSTVTVTGTSGTLNSTATFTLTVN